MTKPTYRWLKIAIALQLLTAIFHSLSFFSTPKATNDTEKQLIELMTTYKMDMGAGFSPTMYGLLTGLSLCFTLIMLLGAAINWRLIARNAPSQLTKEIIGINVLVFGGCFVGMLFFTFLPPIVFTGLVFISLVLAYKQMAHA